MKYVKQHFVTGMKVSLPDVLNRMEDGIAAACAAAVEGIGSVTTGDAPAASIRKKRINPQSLQYVMAASARISSSRGGAGDAGAADPNLTECIPANRFSRAAVR